MRCSWLPDARFGVISVLLLVLLAGGCKKKPKAPPPPEVQFITVALTNIPIFSEWIGTLDGSVNAQIRAQVTGYLRAQNYAEGGRVKKGDLLFEIDPRPFQAALDQTQAKLAQDQAVADKTAIDVKRYIPLAKEQAISQQELDTAIQADLSAKAQVKSDDATIENAKLNLEFTHVTSPIDGLAGTALAQIGDLVSQSGSILTTVSTVDPLKVYFQVNEQSYLTFWQRYVGSQNTNDPVMDLILSDGSTFPEKGRFYYADRQVNANTGTLQITGLFSNRDWILRPGQYGRVRVQTQLKTNTIVLPQRAVTELQGSYQVALITESNTVQVQAVQVGEQVGNQWIVEQGLKAGDKVVVEGTQKAKQGATVNPKPYGAATNETQSAAAPTNSTPPEEKK